MSDEKSYTGPKYILVFGGGWSGIGKGIATSSIGCILKEYGIRTTAVKIDPYLNADAGTLRPTEHGEVWVTWDGGEIDQDLGNYERFLDYDISRVNSITAGGVYGALLEKERRGDFEGKTIQPIPHARDEVLRRIEQACAGYDVGLIEVGGTVGDEENRLFLKAAKKLRRHVGRKNILHCLVAPVPIGTTGEMKTKVVQQSIDRLDEFGIRTDFIFCRSSRPIDDVRRAKIVEYADIEDAANIISAPDCNIHQVPLNLERENLGRKIMDRFGLEAKLDPNWDGLRTLVSRIADPRREVRVALVGKYIKSGDFELRDSYLSVEEALCHAGAAADTAVRIETVDAKELEPGGDLETKVLDRFHGIIVPGGFGSKGVEGKIAAIKHARESGIPFLGLCYGLQLACVEYARNVCGLQGAHTTECDSVTPHPIISQLPEQRGVTELGGTQRCGAYVANIVPGTRVWAMYSGAGRFEDDAARILALLTNDHAFRKGACPLQHAIVERHRHRYEVTPEYVPHLQGGGLMFSGWHSRLDGTKLAEFIELHAHPYFVATQSHPEFMSRLGKPAPLFLGFVQEALRRAK